MLTVFIGGAIVRAYVISKLWEWFVAPPSTPSRIMNVQPRLAPKYLIFGSCVARAGLRAVPRTAGNLEL